MNLRESVAMVAGLVSAFCFLATANVLKNRPRQNVSIEMQVAMPPLAQVFLASGDRYLAANFAAIRALVVTTELMRPEDYVVLARVQSDASWLNPAHEDNYYIATAILPWNDQLAATQTILRRATLARPKDYQPAFYYGFHLIHFLGDAEGASAWVREAAEKLPREDERLIMQNFAARWMDKAKDIDLAIRVVEAMAKQSKRADFRAYLEARAKRLRTLQELRAALDTFKARNHRPPLDLKELIAANILKTPPVDPLGLGFDYDGEGKIELRTRPHKR